MRRLLPGLSVLAAVLCACGPKVLDTEGDSASETDTSEGDATGATDSGGQTGGQTGGTTGGGACEAIADVEPSPAVTVTLRNSGASPVFLQIAQGCDFVDPLTIAGPDGDTPVTWSKGSCSFTCSEIVTGSCGCPAFCAQDTVRMLAPGGSFTIPWSGAVYQPIEAPMACVGEGGCGTQCLQQMQAPSGTYTFTSVGGSDVVGCFDPNNCSCTPNAEGWCDINAMSVGGATMEASGMLMYPGTAVDVVF